MLNNTNLQGRLTKDPELRRTNSGTAVCAFTVAWSEKHKDQERKLFLDCVSWDKSAEFVSKYFRKGSEILVSGKLGTRTWQDKDGNNRHVIELTTSEVNFCGPKQGGDFSAPMDDSDLPF